MVCRFIRKLTILLTIFSVEVQNDSKKIVNSIKTSLVDIETFIAYPLAYLLFTHLDLFEVFKSGIRLPGRPLPP